MLPRTDNAFVPAEWKAFFAGLDEGQRSRGAANLCAAVVAETGLTSAVLRDAVRVIGEGTRDAEVLSSVETLVAQIEDRYDTLESRRSCQETEVKEAFTQARAATAVMFALQEQFTDMAYEAVHAIDDEQRVLNYIRKLDG